MPFYSQGINNINVIPKVQQCNYNLYKSGLNFFVCLFNGQRFTAVW